MKYNTVRKGSSVRQRVLASLGRLDLLQASGTLDRLLASGARLSKQVGVLSACQDSLKANPDGAESRVLGPALVFEPLWTLSGCRQAVHHALAGRRFRFAAERAVFLTVLHRLFAPGSDRSAFVVFQFVSVDSTKLFHELVRSLFELVHYCRRELRPGKGPVEPYVSVKLATVTLSCSSELIHKIPRPCIGII